MGKMRKPLPPAYLLVSIIAILLPHLALPLKVPVRGAWRLAGLALLAMGLALNLAADQSLKQHKSTVKPFERPTTLISGGVFRLSRNPMYLGMTVLLLGIVLALGSISGLLVVALFAVLMDRVFIGAEEKAMEEEFGDKWLAYRRRVRRWV